MTYLDLVESYPKDYKETLFEKVLMAAKRAKALHSGKLVLVDSLHKETYQALEEVRDKAIHLVYREEEAPEELELDEDDGDDE